MPSADNRRHLHRVLDHILDAKAAAELDLDARGWPTAGGGTRRSSTGTSSSTEAAALAGDQAEAWLNAVDVALRRIVSLARIGARRWPPPPARGHRVGGVTVGERDNDLDLCAGCELPILGGKADPARRFDGRPYHKSPCWYEASRAGVSRTA